MKQEFWKPKLVGDRFSGHAVPLEILKDFAALQEMLVEVAKSKFLEAHPGRERVQRNFAKDIELQLVAIEDGSAVLAIALSFSSLFPPQNAQYFDKAKDAIVESIAQSSTGQTPQLAPSFLSYFDRFGRSLRPGESIEFPRQQGNVALNADVRRKLIRAAQVETWTEEAALRAKIFEVNQAQNSFGFELSDGSRSSAPIDDKYRDIVLEALKEYPHGTFFLIQGVVQRDHADRIKGFESIEHITLLDPLDVVLRLDELAKLKDGWLDGGGRAPSHALIDGLKSGFENSFDPSLPLPYLYPTEDGGLQAEWTLGDWEISLEVQSEDLRGEYRATRSKDTTTQTLDLNLADPGGWEQLNAALKSIDNQQPEDQKVAR